MKNKIYLELANTAIQNEKEEKYDIAAEYWGKAKNLATSINAQLWAEYRQEHNQKRHLLHHRHRTTLTSQKENQRTAAALKKHMNKQAVTHDSI